MNRMIEDQPTTDETAHADTEPPTPDEELTAWVRRSRAGNGFGAPEAVPDPDRQSRGNGTNM